MSGWRHGHQPRDGAGRSREVLENWQEMSERNASQTALVTAYLRAAHQVLDQPPLILDDPVALRLLGSGAEQRIREGTDRYQSPEAVSLRSHVVLRSRFAEDRLLVAVQRGVSQYVIVGAGFDTFALRQTRWADSLAIIEVDHPGSQAAKQSRIAEARMQIPKNQVFAGIDFEHESLLAGLLILSSVQFETNYPWPSGKTV